MKTTSRRRWALRALIPGAMVLLLPASPAVGAQAPAPTTDTWNALSSDPRWTPWLGCWQLLEETTREGGAPITGVDSGEWPLNPLRARLRSLQARRVDQQDAADVRLCVVPADSMASVSTSTLVGGRSLQAETVVADATRVAIQEADCAGWRQAEWSRNAARLFTRAELSCRGEAPRAVSGIAMMTPAGGWVDIQVVDLGGRESIRVRRYRRAPDKRSPPAVSPGVGVLPSAALLLPVTSRFDVEDVIEASSKVGATAVEAALVETGTGFPLDSGTWTHLDKAGVAGSVIDVMVALSYPERFVIQRAQPMEPRGPAGQARSGSVVGGSRTSGWVDSWGYSAFDPYYSAPFGWSFSPGWGYSPFWYSPWGAYNPFYFGGPATIIVAPPRGNDRNDASAEPGRVINGRGYTRVRPRGAASDASSPASQQATSGEGAASRAGATQSSSGSSSSSPGGAMSPQGASRGGSGAGSGSSGGGSGRTAKPK